MPDTVESQTAKPPSVLKLKFLSHGTLESTDLDFTRQFYEEFLGLHVVKTSPISLMIKLGGDNTIATVKCKTKLPMNLLNHNGLDVETKVEVNECYRLVMEQKDKWRMTKITKPILQHGTYSFYFWDCDLNCWEILTNPKGGYAWLFPLGDLEGKGHQDKSFKRPGVETPEPMRRA